MIVVNDNNNKIYYNPVNLSEDYKDVNHKIVFTGDLLNDSSILYKNLTNDALIKKFKARNIRLTDIRKSSK